jgi:L-ascorbate metabolism protein UlaG (beta-lactamase superfamily)
MTIKYTWIGHGTHTLEIGGKQILVDPFFTGNPSTDVSPDSVQADYILVSHGHGDHTGDLMAIAKPIPSISAVAIIMILATSN